MFYGAVKGPVFLRFFVRLCGYSAGRRMGRCFTGAGSYTNPGGARSGGQAAGTLRGLRPAGMPPGIRCAPTPRIRGDLRSTGYHAPECRVPVSIRKKEPQRHAPRAPQPLICALLRLHPFHPGAFHILSLQPAQRLHMGLLPRWVRQTELRLRQAP